MIDIDQGCFWMSHDESPGENCTCESIQLDSSSLFSLITPQLQIEEV